jgi:DNA-nicking Smr family endonuclease
MNALGSVERIPDGPRVTEPPEQGPAPGDGPRRPERDPLRRPNPEDPLLAHRSFVRRRVLRDLRAGRIRPARTVDLHRLDRRTAARRVREEIAEAHRARERCVLVVAGRGRHSERGAPLLRDALPGWLADPRLAGAVAAFAAAIPADGGRGAVYVLLA